MSKNFSQIVAELYARPVEGEDLYIRIRQVSEEIRKVIQSEETMSGRFQGLLDSLRGIIPDEQQRYQAALKALSATSKLSRQEVINAMNSQIEELKVLEKSLLPSQTGWQGELQSLEARSQMLKGEMANLRAQIAQLERREQMIQVGIAVREKYLGLAGKTVKELFADIGAEIAALTKKVEELPAEIRTAQLVPSAMRPTPPAQKPTPRDEETVPQKARVKSGSPDKQKEGGEQKVEIKAGRLPVDSKFQRTCPRCGGQLNLLEAQSMWQCFTCGHEEPSTGAVPVTGGLVSEPSSALGGQPASKYAGVEWSPKKPTPSADQRPTKKKTCPVCRKNMYWYPHDKAWRCPSCQYERRI